MTSVFRSRGAKLASAAVVVGAIALSSAVGAAPTVAHTTNSITLTPPSGLGGPAVPGPVAAASTAAPTQQLLTIKPNQMTSGTPITVSGKGLKANTSYSLQWSTQNVSWVVDPEADTVNYLGRTGKTFQLYNVTLGHVTTNGAGAFSTKLVTPVDWGGSHEIYAVDSSNLQQAYGGVVVVRKISVTPSSGPIGTPITITYTGLGASFYTGGASVLWDNRYVGEMQANWTRGVAKAVIRAAGPVGMHDLYIGNAISYLYLNVPQSPIPYTNGFQVPFTVTKDAGRTANAINWPRSVNATVSERTTLDNNGLGANPATLSVTRGPVGTTVHVTDHGLGSNAPITMQWASVVGNRVNCTSTCWTFADYPLGSTTPSGGNVSANIKVPDGLGGWHVVQLIQGGNVIAQTPFYVMESIVGAGLNVTKVKQGGLFTIHLKGVGWTQLDNTLAVDYDNAYMGYACGFNSNGDVVIDIHATGAPGTHIIDLYPMLYSLSPSFANTPYGMVPLLSYAQDDPGLALGYHVPAFRFSVTVVK